MALIPITFKDGSTLEVVGASIPGSEHLANLRNNQDAYGWGFIKDPATFVAVVADGCSNEEAGANEVGANIGVELIKSAILRTISENGYPNAKAPEDKRIADFWEDIAEYFVQVFGENLLASSVNPGYTSFADLIKSYGLFTVNGLLITDSAVDFFFIGDGIVAVNDKDPWMIGGKHGRTPPFIMYRAVPDLVSFKERKLRFNPARSAIEMNTFLIGTDGVMDLMNVADKKMPDPSSNEKVGPLSQFWKNDIYFKARNALHSKLSRINKEIKVAKLDKIRGESIAKLEIFPGLLPDDTTMIVGRRIKK